MSVFDVIHGQILDAIECVWLWLIIYESFQLWGKSLFDFDEGTFSVNVND